MNQERRGFVNPRKKVWEEWIKKNEERESPTTERGKEILQMRVELEKKTFQCIHGKDNGDLTQAVDGKRKGCKRSMLKNVHVH